MKIKKSKRKKKKQEEIYTGSPSITCSSKPIRRAPYGNRGECKKKTKKSKKKTKVGKGLSFW
jgi:hypothetical protein